MFNFNNSLNNGYPIMFGMPDVTRCRHANWQNNIQYYDTFVNFVDLFTNIFEWEGLPDTCNERALETQLLFNGNSLFFRHKENGGLYHSPFDFTGRSNPEEGINDPQFPSSNPVNIYGENTHFRTTNPVYQENFDSTNAVYIRATPTMFPLWITLDIYAQKITDAFRTIDVVSHTMKRPFLVRGTKDLKVTIRKIFEQHAENELLVVTDKNVLDPKDWQVFPTPVDDGNLSVLWDNLHNMQDELYKRLGIQSARNDKPERMVVSEAESSKQITQSNIMYMLDYREKGAKAINEMFGTNISVKIKHEYIEDDRTIGLVDDNDGGGKDDEPRA